MVVILLVLIRKYQISNRAKCFGSDHLFYTPIVFIHYDLVSFMSSYIILWLFTISKNNKNLFFCWNLFDVAISVHICSFLILQQPYIFVTNNGNDFVFFIGCFANYGKESKNNNYWMSRYIKNRASEKVLFATIDLDRHSFTQMPKNYNYWRLFRRVNSISQDPKSILFIF